MFNNKSPGLTSEFLFKNGGIKDLNLIKQSELDIVSGVKTSNINNLLNFSDIDIEKLNDGVEYKPFIQGPKRIKINTPHQWKITNYNINYIDTPLTSYGFIELIGDTINFIPNSEGLVSFILAGRKFEIESFREFIQKPTLKDPLMKIKEKHFTIESSEFEPINITDSHLSTDWEIYLDQNLEQIKTKSEEDTVNLNRILIEDLELNKSYFIRTRYKGLSFPEKSAWSDILELKTSSTDEVFVEKPTIVYPLALNSSVSIKPSIKASEFKTINWPDSFKASEWQLSPYENFESLSFETNGVIDLTTGNFPVLPPKTFFFVRVRYQSENFGWSEWSDPVHFRTEQIEINQPEFSYPINNQENLPFNFELKLKPYNAIGNAPHLFTDWEIAKDQHFETVLFSSYQDASNKTTFNLNNLSPITFYYARVRFITREGIFSEWSLPVKFSTETLKINKPVISEITSSGIFKNKFQLSPMVSNSENLSHLETDWVLANDKLFTQIVFDNFNSRANLLQWETGILQNQKKYFVRARFRANTGLESAWSDHIEFTVESYPYAPTITKTNVLRNGSGDPEYPQGLEPYSEEVSRKVLKLNTDGETTLLGTPVTVKAESLNGISWTKISFESSVGIEAQITRIETSSDISELVIGDLFPVTIYFNYYNETSGRNVDSTFLSVGKVEKELVTPEKGNPKFPQGLPIFLSDRLVQEFSTSNFVSESNERFLKTEWAVSNTRDFNSILKQYTTNNLKLLIEDLPLDKIYFIKARHVSSSNFIGIWSEVLEFKPLEVNISKPSITSPSKNYISNSKEINFTSSVFKAINIESINKAIWEYSLTSDFSRNNTLVEKLNPNYNNLLLNLDYGKSYYIRVKYFVETGIESIWSEVLPFSIREAKVNKPTINNLSSSLTIGTHRIITSNFSSEGELTFNKTIWEISSDPNFAYDVQTKESNTLDFSIIVEL